MAATPQSAPHHPPPLHHPSSASKKSNVAAAAAGGAAVHTPAGPASAPRSVPSPAAIRVSSGKTPVGGAGGGMKMGGTPMGLSLSSLGMSPPSGFTPGMMMMNNGGGGMGMGGMPIAGFTPNSSSAAATAAMMMPSMSELGLSASSIGGKRGGDGGEYERKRKMRSVLRKIGGRSGGVCEEGICRVARRVGLANDVDAEGEEARREREGERAISIAGRDVLIDVDMKGNRARGVVVAGMGGVEEREMERAGKVLEGLLVEREGEGEGDLEGFGRELGRIAGLDRVGERGVSAFEAVSGVGSSLERLFQKECEGEDERMVLRKKSGRPWMHARGRIGWGVDFWTTSPPPPPQDDNAMDLDHQRQQQVEEDSANFLTLHLTAETCPAGMYPPVRISTTWLPEDLSSSSKTNENSATSDHQIPWQDPPPTYTTPSEDETAAGTEPQQPSKLPDIRFLAKLDPPLIVPYSVASQLFAEMGGEGIQGMVMFREWHLMLASEVDKSCIRWRGAKTGGATATAAADTNPTIRDAQLRERGLRGSAVVFRQGRDGDGDDEEVKHLYHVDVTKAEWGYRLTEMPFAHPREVVGCLGVLRQWGVFQGLVGSLLGSDVGGNGIPEEGEGGKGELLDRLLLEETSTTTIPDEKRHGKGEEVDGGGEAAGGYEKRNERGGLLRVRVEICTTPLPTLSLQFPLLRRQVGEGYGGEEKNGMGMEMGMGKVVLQVGRNADVECVLVEGFGTGSGDGTEMEDEAVVRKRMAKGLEVCGGDLGVWIEWVRGGGGWGRKGEGKGKGRGEVKGDEMEIEMES